MVISASTRAVTSATAGLARRMASWTDVARAGAAARVAASASIAAGSTFMTSDRITEAPRFAPGAAARRGPGRPGPRRRQRAQHCRGSLALMPGHISGPDGSTTTPAAGGTTMTAGGAITGPLRGLADGYSTSPGHAEAGLP